MSKKLNYISGMVVGSLIAAIGLTLDTGIETYGFTAKNVLFTMIAVFGLATACGAGVAFFREPR